MINMYVISSFVVILYWVRCDDWICYPCRGIRILYYGLLSFSYALYVYYCHV